MSNTKSVPISTIRPRASNDTRPLDPAHVLDLAASIAVLGLLQPLAVDASNRLLAGGHRLAACRLVAIADTKARQKEFEKTFPNAKQFIERIVNLDRSGWVQRHPDNRIPVRVIEIDSNKDVDAAFSVEVAENEKRKNYSLDEVQVLAERLRSLGYVEREGGRPRVGERALRPMLAAVVGKSERQIRRMLQGKRSDVTRPSGQVSRRKPTRPRGQVRTWKHAVGGLKRAVVACRSIGKGNLKAKQLLVLLDRVERMLKAA